MNQQNQPPENQQWQQQGFPPPFQHPQAQAQAPFQHIPPHPPATPMSSMPMSMSGQSTPQLNAMYSQAQGGMPAQGQQQPHVHFQDEQMPQQAYGQDLPAQPQQQQLPFTPQASLPQHQQATPWETQNIHEVNPIPPTPTPQQNPSSHAAALAQARQRIHALEAAREQQDTERALQLSAQEIFDDAELREREERQVHEVMLRSLDSYEEDLRRGLMGGRYGGDDDGSGSEDSYAAGSGTAFPHMSATAASAFPHANHSVNPPPTIQHPGPSHQPTHQTQHHPPPHHTAPAYSQTASLANSTIDLDRTSRLSSSTPAPSLPQAWTNTPAPRPYTPTPGVAPANAAMNLGLEEERRRRGFRARQAGRGVRG